MTSPSSPSALPAGPLPTSASAPLLVHPGTGPVVFVAPHAAASVASVRHLFRPEEHVELDARVADWIDEGSLEALDAAHAVSGGPAARPSLPRAIFDLNRGEVRPGVKETLFDKGAVDDWTTARLTPDAAEALRAIHRAQIATLRELCDGRTALVELHSYGELGSTYDQLNGGRPVRRAAACIVESMPWTTATPLGLARLVPGDLIGCPWPIRRRIGDALADQGIELGPSPYPRQGPWTLSARFLASRWFDFIAARGLLPDATAAWLKDRVWGVDAMNPRIDAAAAGQPDPELPGLDTFSRHIGAWSREPSELSAEFLRETGTLAFGVELRLDLAPRADLVGMAVGRIFRPQ